MQYIITGETTDSHRNITPDELTLVLDKGLILHLQIYNELGFKTKISSNGTSKKRIGIAIVNGKSIMEIKRILVNAPSWFKVNWTVVPLERS